MWSEPKDPDLKLFGKTIQFPEFSPQAVESNQTPESEYCTSPDKEEGPDSKESSSANPSMSKQEDESQRSTGEDSLDHNAASGISENNKTSSVDEDNASQTDLKSEEEQSETSNSQEKPLKKPDKILPCPRCNSMDTKFCYYNNYNANQPRHFCKNCQRYWTAGGTMRNVPVGAGRRKNKTSASHYNRHITVPDALQNVQVDIPNGVHPVKPNGTVLTFGTSDTPLCESMSSTLNLANKTMRGSPRNAFHKPDSVTIPGACTEHSIDPLNGSSTVNPNSKGSDGKNGTVPGIASQIHCYPGAPWPYPWSSGQWGSTHPLTTPYYPPGFALPFFPVAAAYWGCSVPGAWSLPWVPGPFSPVTPTTGSGPNSPTLGKHSRDEQSLSKQNGSGEDEEPAKESSAEKCLWIPKTLRIDDPREAAKSSIWATLGIKHDKAEVFSEGGPFKAFQSKGEERIHSSEASPVLQANPAALSRSVNFQESS